VCLHAVKGEVRMAFRTDIMEAARAFCELESEQFATEHLWRAMDSLLAGSCYGERDAMADKFTALETRVPFYLAYDRLMAETGQTGSSDTDSARKRISIYDEHVGEISTYGKDEQDRLFMHLSLLSKTNLLFVGREVMDFAFTWFSHLRIVDHFIQKSPWLPIREMDEKKKRLTMAPRGFFKSTISIADLAQFVIVSPDIRVLILCSTIPLARAFVGQLKALFTPDDPDNLTVFQTLFALDARLERAHDGEVPRLRFLLEPGEQGKETEFDCPARRKGGAKERTCVAGSIGKSLVGAHQDLFRADDSIDPKNSETAALTEKTNLKLEYAERLIDPSLYIEYIGTCFSPNDRYAKIRNELANQYSILVAPAKTLKRNGEGTTAVERGKAENLLEASDHKLLFAVDKFGNSKLSNAYLEDIKKGAPEVYRSQYLLDPRGIRETTFSEALIQNQMIPNDRIPAEVFTNQKHILADLADSVASSADWSVLAVLGADNEGRGYILDSSVRGRFLISELVKQIALMNDQIHPASIIIENSRGAEKLKSAIESASRALGTPTINLIFKQVDTSKNAKISRISRLEKRLFDRRLFFSSSILFREELIEELTTFPHGRFDDCADACAFSEEVLSDDRPKPANSMAQADAESIIRNKEMYEMFLGSPEDHINDSPLLPLPGTESEPGTGDGHGNELWNPFGVASFGKR
jgi:phage terminase large subunit-like protein